MRSCAFTIAHKVQRTGGHSMASAKELRSRKRLARMRPSRCARLFMLAAGGLLPLPSPPCWARSYPVAASGGSTARALELSRIAMAVDAELKSTISALQVLAGFGAFRIAAATFPGAWPSGSRASKDGATPAGRYQWRDRPERQPGHRPGRSRVRHWTPRKHAAGHRLRAPVIGRVVAASACRAVRSPCGCRWCGTGNW